MRPSDEPGERGADGAGVEEVLVGRQPIVDRAGTVVAYELLFRHAGGPASRRTAEQMTPTVVAGALSIGVERLVGSATIFCNADRGVLIGTTPIGLPPRRTVLEVLETVDIDDEVVAGCRRLLHDGFRLALDDFVWRHGADDLLPLVSVVKIDVQAVPPDELPALVARCRTYDVQLLAEKVETAEQVALARDLGFDLFQGYAIARPAVVRGRTLPESALSRIQLATSLLSRELDLDEVESVLSREPALAAQALQLAAIGPEGGVRRPVRTIREALVVLGTKAIREWIGVRLIAAQPGPTPDGLVDALTRAHLVSEEATRRAIASPDVAFTAGLLSSLDLLLGTSLVALAEQMDIDPELASAAFGRVGALGGLIDEVAAYQSALLVGGVTAGDGARWDAEAARAFEHAAHQVAAIAAAA